MEHIQVAKRVIRAALRVSETVKQIKYQSMTNIKIGIHSGDTLAASLGF